MSEPRHARLMPIDIQVEISGGGIGMAGSTRPARSSQPLVVPNPPTESNAIILVHQINIRRYVFVRLI